MKANELIAQMLESQAQSIGSQLAALKGRRNRNSLGRPASLRRRATLAIDAFPLPPKSSAGESRQPRELTVRDGYGKEKTMVVSRHHQGSNA